jgi:hypothetical protein
LDWDSAMAVADARKRDSYAEFPTTRGAGAAARLAQGAVSLHLA